MVCLIVLSAQLLLVVGQLVISEPSILVQVCQYVNTTGRGDDMVRGAAWRGLANTVSPSSSVPWLLRWLLHIISRTS